MGGPRTAGGRAAAAGRARLPHLLPIPVGRECAECCVGGHDLNQRSGGVTWLRRDSTRTWTDWRIASVHPPAFAASPRRGWRCRGAACPAWRRPTFSRQPTGLDGPRPCRPCTITATNVSSNGCARRIALSDRAAREAQRITRGEEKPTLQAKGHQNESTTERPRHQWPRLHACCPTADHADAPAHPPRRASTASSSHPVRDIRTSLAPLARPVSRSFSPGRTPGGFLSVPSRNASCRRSLSVLRMGLDRRTRS